MRGSTALPRLLVAVLLVAATGCGTTTAPATCGPPPAPDGRAVALGAVRPDQPVRVGDWERWEVLNPSETAHARALDALGIPAPATAPATRTAPSRSTRSPPR